MHTEERIELSGLFPLSVTLSRARSKNAQSNRWVVRVLATDSGHARSNTCAGLPNGRFLSIKEERARCTTRSGISVKVKRCVRYFIHDFHRFCLPTSETLWGHQRRSKSPITQPFPCSASPCLALPCPPPHSTADTTILITVSNPRSLPPPVPPRLKFSANRPLSRSLHPLSLPQPPSPCEPTGSSSVC